MTVSLTTLDAQEGIKAFLEKRKARLDRPVRAGSAASSSH